MEQCGFEVVACIDDSSEEVRRDIARGFRMHPEFLAATERDLIATA